MSTLRFVAFPQDVGDRTVDLTGAYLTGRDDMPWPTEVDVVGGIVECHRSVEGSASLRLRWDVMDVGRIVLSTTVLMTREEPYYLEVELVREKVRTLRNRVADCEEMAIEVSDETQQLIRRANQGFLAALSSQPDTQLAADLAAQSLRDGVLASEKLALEIARNLLQREPPSGQSLPPALLGCRLPDGIDAAEHRKAFTDVFGYASVDMAWAAVEPGEGQYQWDGPDRGVQWCLEHDVLPKAGPLVSFRERDLPAWLRRREFADLVTFVCDYVETVVDRFRENVQIWEVVAAANNASASTLTEDDLIQLASRAIEVAKRVQPEAIAILTITDPWGDYMAEGRYSLSPLNFAEAIIRNNVGVSVIGLEVLHGLGRPGCHCRDLMELSDLLDRYGKLGPPIHISALAVPSATGPDHQTALDEPLDPADGGSWHRPWDPDLQADWLEAFLEIAISKPFIHAVTYTDFVDTAAKRLPHSSLLDADGKPKPAYEALKRVRHRHLTR